jgi:16S rRNA (uracil1498-N3)-methyltransferase
MHRFYLPPEECEGGILTLTDREAHHAARVLRLRRGEAVVVLNGVGKVYHTEVDEVSRDVVRLSIKRTEESPAPPCAITLVQAIPKGKLLDSIIQKATELGVSRVIPLLSERVITQIDEGNAESKTEHWRTVAVEAIKQSGSPWLPDIEPAASPGQLLARREKFDLWFIASLQPGSRHPREWFQEFRAREGLEPRTACIWVGPEGDFTEREVADAIAAGARPITLGRLVLRCETAATYCLSVLNYETQSREA